MKCKRIDAFDVSLNPGWWKMNRLSVCVISNLSYTQSYGTGICVNSWNFVWNIWHIMLWEQTLWQIYTSDYCWSVEWKYFQFCMWIRSGVFKFSHFDHLEFRSIVQIVRHNFHKFCTKYNNIAYLEQYTYKSNNDFGIGKKHTQAVYVHDKEHEYEFETN